MVVALRGELDPDARPVEPDVVAQRVAHVRRARVGHLNLVEFGLVELAVFGALGAVARPGGDRPLDELLRGVGELGDRDPLAPGGELAVLLGADVDVVESRIGASGSCVLPWSSFQTVGCAATW